MNGRWWMPTRAEFMALPTFALFFTLLVSAMFHVHWSLSQSAILLHAIPQRTPRVGSQDTEEKTRLEHPPLNRPAG